MTRLQRRAWLAGAFCFSLASPLRAADIASPPATAYTVTPSDTVSIPETTWLYVGTTGNLRVTMAGNGGAGSGGTVVLNAVPVGMYQLRVTQVWSTSTTASNIVAFYP